MGGGGKGPTGSRALRAGVLRRSGIATLLATAALALSGCWGVVVGPSSGERALVIPGNVTDQIIAHCSQNGVVGYGRGRCALGAVWNLCEAIPLPNLPREWCLSFTWPDHIADIEEAIVRVLNTDARCLVAYFNRPPPHPNPNDWTAVPLGFACTAGSLPGTG